jgi:uncharacterized protein YjcR
MSLSNLSSAQLSKLIGLIKEKESLQAKLDKVESAISAIEGGKSAPGKRGRKPGRPPGSKSSETGRKSKRLKAPILKLLSAAGSSGITVKDLANKLKVKPGNIFSWFYTTGKKINGIKKVGEAKYAYAG